MKYPIDIEKMVAAFKEMHPNDSNGVKHLEAFLPLENEAYAQGVADGRAAKV